MSSFYSLFWLAKSKKWFLDCLSFSFHEELHILILSIIVGIKSVYICLLIFTCVLPVVHGVAEFKIVDDINKADVQNFKYISKQPFLVGPYYLEGKYTLRISCF